VAQVKLGIETTSIEYEIQEIELVCREKEYWNHLARLKLAEAELMQRKRSYAALEAAVREAVRSALRFNILLAAEILNWVQQFEERVRLLAVVDDEMTAGNVLRAARSSVTMTINP